jgi:DNA helicase HerA-like ATPase
VGDAVSQPPANFGSSAVDVFVGRALDWHEPGWGTFLTDVPHAVATREIDAIPGSGELPVHSSLTPWGFMRGVALQLLSGAAFMPGCDAVELRYITTPTAAGPSRTRMFITAKARDWHPAVAEAAVDAACAALPKAFTWAAPEQPMGFGGDAAVPDLTIVELRRDEEVTIPQWDYIPAEFYYMINDDPGDSSGWPMFWHVLSGASRPVTTSLLFKQTDLHWDERNVLGSVTSDLALLAEQHTDSDIFGEQVFYPACANARVALDSWNQRIAQLHRPLLTRLAVRAEVQVAAPIATALATAIGASMTGAGSNPMYVEAPMSDVDERQAAFSFDWLEILPWGGHPLWTSDDTKNQAPHSLRRLPYLFGLNEAAGLAVLPVPDLQGVPGFSRARRIAGRRAAVLASADAPDGVVLGHLLDEGQPAGPLVLPLTAINRHVLVVGSPGSGKTTTVMSLLAELWRQHGVPFLVIEPIKTEYRSLLEASGLDELSIFSLGRDDLSPLRLNPLAPPPHVRREVHASAVIAALKLALPLFPPLPQLLGDALDLAYERAGWDEDTTSEAGIAAPTLRDLLQCFEVVFAREDYKGEARNLAAAGRVRLRSLLRGSLGRMLDTVESVDFDELLSRPVVIELDEIADTDDKAVIAAFVLDRIRSAARARGSTAGQLRHVTIVEEAHRLLGRTASQGGGRAEGDNARVESVRAFCEAIAELRGQGEGFVLSTQSPSTLAEAALATTGTRILHRLTTAADRDAVLNDLDASQLDREAAARLKRGEAIIMWPEQDEPEIAQVVEADGIDSGRHLGDDEVASRMRSKRDQVKALLPYKLCTREVCSTGCDGLVRSAGRSLAADLSDQAKALWDPSSGGSLKTIPQLVAKESGGDVQACYCTAVHLAVAGDAFTLKRNRDIRPQLVEAIRQAVTGS